jgi:D-amino peptidase
MIRCDMEGASGVVSYDQVVPGSDEYAVGRSYFMSDLLALVEGLYEGGADDVVIYDEHFDGRNVDVAALPANTRLIAGKPPYKPGCAGGLDDSFTGMILLGLHSMAGSGELLHHSYEPDIACLRLNGREVGEIGVEAAIAGDFGVPTLLVVGDSAAAEEAQALMPEVRCVAVKRSLGPTSAECIPLKDTAGAIADTARSIAQGTRSIVPFHYGDTAELLISLNDGPFRRAFVEVAPDMITDEGVVTLRGENITRLWAQYWQLKLKCQAVANKG